MKNFAASLLTILASLIIGLIFNTVVSAITGERGTVTIGPTLIVNDMIYTEITVANYSDNIQSNLIFNVPVDVEVYEISSSSPLEIKEVYYTIGKNNEKRLSISGFEPRSITRLLLPISNETDASMVRVVNQSEKKITYEPTSNLQGYITRSISNLVPNIVLYALFFGIYMFYTVSKEEQIDKKRREDFEKRTEALEKTLEERKLEFANLTTQMEKSEAKVKEFEKLALRYKVLMFARLSDYAKELEFWRSMFRKSIYEAKGDQQIADILIRQVTRALKTYALNGKNSVEDIDNFETVRYLADVLNDSEGEHSKPKQ